MGVRKGVVTGVGVEKDAEESVGGVEVTGWPTRKIDCNLGTYTCEGRGREEDG